MKNLLIILVSLTFAKSQTVKDLFKKNGPLHLQIAHGCTHEASEWLVSIYSFFLVKIKRMAFHDAATYDSKNTNFITGPGGLDGSLEIEIENPKHAGLTAAIMHFRTLVSFDVSFSDIVVAGTIIALKV